MTSTLISRKAFLEAKRRIMSQWKPPPNTNSGSASSWPASVRYTGYTVSLVAVPYTVLYLFSTTPSKWRDEFSRSYPWFRTHFGSLELQNRPYEEQLGNPKEYEPAYSLPGEDDSRTRALQEQIAARSEQMISVLVHDSSSNTTEERVKGSVAVRDFVKGSSSSYKEDPATNASYVSLTFPDETIDMEDEGPTNTFTQNEHDDSTGIHKSIRSEVNVYSLWHAFPVTNGDTTSSSSLKKSAPSANEIERSRLEYRIKELETELKSNNSSRSIDDIQQDLKDAKREYSRTKGWRFW